MNGIVCSPKSVRFEFPTLHDVIAVTTRLPHRTPAESCTRALAFAEEKNAILILFRTLNSIMIKLSCLPARLSGVRAIAPARASQSQPTEQEMKMKNDVNARSQAESKQNHF